ncbi:Eukaryotic translation initiation factor 3 subunit F, partial [Apiospora aurea]
MAVDQESFLHMSRPLAPTVNIQSNIAPLSVNIQPQVRLLPHDVFLGVLPWWPLGASIMASYDAILSILDHAVRRDEPATETTSPRVIGALIGTRSDDGSELSVSSAFAIPHTENEDQVEVDVEYQKNMLSLHLKASPRETLLGWYTTSHELNSFSALIQNFFASPETGTFPHPAVHLTVSTDPGADVQLKSYISAPVAVNADRAAESCLFIQVPHRVSYNDAERSALELISSAKDTESRTTTIPSDVEGLARSLESMSDLLERVSGYVGEILDEEREPNNALGQYLMSALSLAPKVDPSAIEHDFNNHIQDVLMVSYLANSIRTQIDLSQRLATAVLSDEKAEKDDTKGEK